MAVTLPQETRTIDDAFMTTWYEIRPDATDNILLATPISALLKERGCFTPQTGGSKIERSLRYAVGNATSAVSKGDTLPMGVTETQTGWFWTFRNNAVAIQRDTITDAENAGALKIKDYVAKRLGEARDSIVQKQETDYYRAIVTDETGKEWQSLNDLLPPYASANVGTYGGINRPLTFTQIAAANGVYAPATGNTFNGSKYKQMTLPYELNLVSDMKVLYNSIYNNQEAPNVLICDQATFELYEEFAVDKAQLVKDDSTMLADLGFETLRYKGKPMFWTPNAAINSIQMLNTDYIEVVYRPNLWMAMSEWKPIPNQMERLAHIISAANIIGTQPRRHGLLTSASVS